LRKQQGELSLPAIQQHQTICDCSCSIIFALKIASHVQFLRQLLFEFFDRLEEVTEFFHTGEDLIGAEFQQLDFFLFQAIFNLVPGDRS
jgi:hypothetical protein